MDDEGCGPDVVTYTVRIDALCTARKLDCAKEVFAKMKAGRHKPDRVTYITLLDRFGDNRDLDSVKHFWSGMEKDGYAPDVLYHFRGCSVQSWDFGEACDTLDVMRDHGIIPNLHTYNTLICGLLRVHRLDGALQLFGNMEFLGVKPTAYTYIAFIDYYGKSGDSVSSLETFEKMKTKRIAPNIVACNASHYSLACMVGRVDEGLNYFKELKESGLKPDVVCYNLIINGLGKSQRLEEALILFNEMKNSRGITPDPYIYNSLIQNLGIAGMVEEAWKIYSEIQRVGLEPNVFTFNALIRGYSLSEKPKHAYAVHQTMVTGGFSPNKGTYEQIPNRA